MLITTGHLSFVLPFVFSLIFMLSALVFEAISFGLSRLSRLFLAVTGTSPTTMAIARDTQFLLSILSAYVTVELVFHAYERWFDDGGSSRQSGKNYRSSKGNGERTFKNS